MSKEFEMKQHWVVFRDVVTECFLRVATIDVRRGWYASSRNRRVIVEGVIVIVGIIVTGVRRGA